MDNPQDELPHSSARVTRLKQRREFVAASASRHKWVRPAFVLQCAANDEMPARAQLGFTTSKRLGNAVIRNFIRRRLREAARKFLPQSLQPGFNYVIIGRPDAATIDFATLGKELHDAVEKLHRIMAQKTGH